MITASTLTQFNDRGPLTALNFFPGNKTTLSRYKALLIWLLHVDWS